jgi:hypothetical protein
VIDQQIEQEIQAKGLTAPRITLADIEANIASEHFFTADDGEWGASKHANKPRHPQLSLLTFCVLVLRNGFTVTGESACASPENFDAEVGRKIARQNAVAKIWPLLGYELRSKLAWKDSTLRVTRQIGSGPGAFFNVEVGKNWDYSALQPIDTAPTDGTVFLGYRERDRRWGECYRIQRDDCEMWSFGGSSAAAEGFPEFKPSHWMPLPGVE